MAKRKDDEQGDNEGGQQGGESAGAGEKSEGGVGYGHIKAELVQLENECAGAISVNEQGERSQVDQILQTMYRRLKEVNKAV